MLALVVFVCAVVSLSPAAADIAVVYPYANTTLNVGQPFTAIVSFSEDLSFCAQGWSLFMSGGGNTIRVYQHYYAGMDKESDMDNPLVQTVTTDCIPYVFQQTKAYSVQLYVRCDLNGGVTYSATALKLHDVVTAYAEFTMPTTGYWGGDDSMINWMVYGPQTNDTKWLISASAGQQYVPPNQFVPVCTTTVHHCAWQVPLADYYYIRVRDLEYSYDLYTIGFGIQHATMKLVHPFPSVTPNSNITIQWSTTGPVETLSTLQYNINNGANIDMDTTNPHPKNTGSYTWHVPNTIKVGDDITITGCIELGTSCDSFALTVIPPPPPQTTEE